MASAAASNAESNQDPLTTPLNSNSNPISSNDTTTSSNSTNPLNSTSNSSSSNSNETTNNPTSTNTTNNPNNNTSNNPTNTTNTNDTLNPTNNPNETANSNPTNNPTNPTNTNETSNDLLQRLAAAAAAERDAADALLAAALPGALPAAPSAALPQLAAIPLVTPTATNSIANANSNSNAIANARAAALADALLAAQAAAAAASVAAAQSDAEARSLRRRILALESKLNSAARRLSREDVNASRSARMHPGRCPSCAFDPEEAAADLKTTAACAAERSAEIDRLKQAVHALSIENAAAAKQLRIDRDRIAQSEAARASLAAKNAALEAASKSSLSQITEYMALTEKQQKNLIASLSEHVNIRLRESTESATHLHRQFTGFASLLADALMMIWTLGLSLDERRRECAHLKQLIADQDASQIKSIIDSLKNDLQNHPDNPALAAAATALRVCVADNNNKLVSALNHLPSSIRASPIGIAVTQCINKTTHAIQTFDAAHSSDTSPLEHTPVHTDSPASVHTLLKDHLKLVENRLATAEENDLRDQNRHSEIMERFPAIVERMAALEHELKAYSIRHASAVARATAPGYSRERVNIDSPTRLSRISHEQDAHNAIESPLIALESLPRSRANSSSNVSVVSDTHSVDRHQRQQQSLTVIERLQQTFDFVSGGGVVQTSVAILSRFGDVIAPMPHPHAIRALRKDPLYSIRSVFVDAATAILNSDTSRKSEDEPDALSVGTMLALRMLAQREASIAYMSQRIKELEGGSQRYDVEALPAPISDTAHQPPEPIKNAVAINTLPATVNSENTNSEMLRHSHTHQSFGPYDQNTSNLRDRLERTELKLRTAQDDNVDLRLLLIASRSEYRLSLDSIRSHTGRPDSTTPPGTTSIGTQQDYPRSNTVGIQTQAEIELPIVNDTPPNNNAANVVSVSTQYSPLTIGDDAMHKATQADICASSISRVTQTQQASLVSVSFSTQTDVSSTLTDDHMQRNVVTTVPIIHDKHTNTAAVSTVHVGIQHNPVEARRAAYFSTAVQTQSSGFPVKASQTDACAVASVGTQSEHLLDQSRTSCMNTQTQSVAQGSMGVQTDSSLLVPHIGLITPHERSVAGVGPTLASATTQTHSKAFVSHQTQTESFDHTQTPRNFLDVDATPETCDASTQIGESSASSLLHESNRSNTTNQPDFMDMPSTTTHVLPEDIYIAYPVYPPSAPREVSPREIESTEHVRHTDQESRIEDLSAEITRLTGRIVALTAMNVELESLAPRLTDCKSLLAQSRQDLAEVEARCRAAEHRATASKAAADDLTTLVETKDMELVVVLQREAHALESLHRIEKEMQSLRSDYKDVCAQRDVHASDLTKLRDDLDMVQQRYQDTLHQLTESLSVVDGLKSSSGDELEAATRKIVALLSENHGMVSRIRDLERRVEELLGQCRQEEQMRRDIESQLSLSIQNEHDAKARHDTEMATLQQERRVPELTTTGVQATTTTSSIGVHAQDLVETSVTTPASTQTHLDRSSLDTLINDLDLFKSLAETRRCEVETARIAQSSAEATITKLLNEIDTMRGAVTVRKVAVLNAGVQVGVRSGCDVSCQADHDDVVVSAQSEAAQAAAAAARIEKLEDKLAQNIAQAQEQQDAFDQLSRDMDTFRAQLTETEQQARSAREERDHIHSASETLRKQLDHSRAKVNSLEIDLHAIQASRTSLQKSVRELQANKTALESQIQALVTRLHERSSSMVHVSTQADTDREDFENRLQAMDEHRSATLSALRAELQHIHHDHERQEQGWQTITTNINTRLSNTSKELATVTNDLQLCREELARVTKTQTDVEAMLDERNAEIAGLQMEISEKTRAFDALRTTMEQFEHRVTDHEPITSIIASAPVLEHPASKQYQKQSDADVMQDDVPTQDTTAVVVDPSIVTALQSKIVDLQQRAIELHSLKEAENTSLRASLFAQQQRQLSGLSTLVAELDQAVEHNKVLHLSLDFANRRLQDTKMRLQAENKALRNEGLRLRSVLIEAAQQRPAMRVMSGAATRSGLSVSSMAAASSAEPMRIPFGPKLVITQTPHESSVDTIARVRRALQKLQSRALGDRYGLASWIEVLDTGKHTDAHTNNVYVGGKKLDSLARQMLDYCDMLAELADVVVSSLSCRRDVHVGVAADTASAFAVDLASRVASLPTLRRAVFSHTASPSTTDLSTPVTQPPDEATYESVVHILFELTRETRAFERDAGVMRSVVRQLTAKMNASTKPYIVDTDAPIPCSQDPIPQSTQKQRQNQSQDTSRVVAASSIDAEASIAIMEQSWQKLVSQQTHLRRIVGHLMKNLFKSRAEARVKDTVHATSTVELVSSITQTENGDRVVVSSCGVQTSDTTPSRVMLNTDTQTESHILLKTEVPSLHANDESQSHPSFVHLQRKLDEVSASAASSTHALVDSVRECVDSRSSIHQTRTREPSTTVHRADTDDSDRVDQDGVLQFMDKIVSLQNDMAELVHERDRLRHALSVAKVREEALHKVLSLKESETDKIQTPVEQQDASVGSLSHHVDTESLQAQIAALERDKISLKRSLTMSETRLRASSSLASTFKQTLAARAQDAQRTKLRVGELEALVAQLKERQQHVSPHTTHIDTQTNSESAQSAKTHIVSDTMVQHTDALARIRILETENASLNRTITSLRNVSSLPARDAQSKQDTHKAHVEQITTLRMDLAAARGAVVALEQRVTAREAQHRRDLAAMRAERDAVIHARATASYESIASTTSNPVFSRIQQADPLREHFERRVEALQTQNTELRDAISRLELELQQRRHQTQHCDQSTFTRIDHHDTAMEWMRGVDICSRVLSRVVQYCDASESRHMSNDMSVLRVAVHQIHAVLCQCTSDSASASLTRVEAMLDDSIWTLPPAVPRDGGLMQSGTASIDVTLYRDRQTLAAQVHGAANSCALALESRAASIPWLATIRVADLIVRLAHTVLVPGAGLDRQSIDDWVGCWIAQESDAANAKRCSVGAQTISPAVVDIGVETHVDEASVPTEVIDTGAYELSGRFENEIGARPSDWTRLDPVATVPDLDVIPLHHENNNDMRLVTANHHIVSTVDTLHYLPEIDPRELEFEEELRQMRLASQHALSKTVDVLTGLYHAAATENDATPTSMDGYDGLSDRSRSLERVGMGLEALRSRANTSFETVGADAYRVGHGARSMMITDPLDAGLAVQDVDLPLSSLVESTPDAMRSLAAPIAPDTSSDQGSGSNITNDAGEEMDDLRHIQALTRQSLETTANTILASMNQRQWTGSSHTDEFVDTDARVYPIEPRGDTELQDVDVDDDAMVDLSDMDHIRLLTQQSIATTAQTVQMALRARPLANASQMFDDGMSDDADTTA